MIVLSLGEQRKIGLGGFIMVKKRVLVLFSMALILFGATNVVNVSATGSTLDIRSEIITKISQESGMSEKEAQQLLLHQQNEYEEGLRNWEDNIELQDSNFKALVDEKYESGEFKNKSDVVVELLPKLKNQEFYYDELSGELQTLENTNASLASTSSKLGTYGDVLVTMDLSSASSGGIGGHAAIVSEHSDYWTVESFAIFFSPQDPNSEGVQWHVNDWKTRYNTVAGYHVYGVTLTDYENAGKYAEAQIRKSYNFSFLDKKRTDSFYCSQLVWRAWFNQGVDIDGNGGLAVWPVDFTKSSNLVAFHKDGIK